ncbi:glycoside hydrolase family 15 protein [Natrinema amylolyticum]|uniref:glycoside hydrolase family 15 protein n=1 Tax=Natrinema amylolyticum TaxID=2878679 RepID=UPI001CFB979C|nr:glycoside hydrolase family 15 protein [Natrinema amylolyticum]
MPSPNAQDAGTECKERSEYRLIGEYGAVGNLETVALIGRDGAVDWCCFPHIESPSLFARLLDSRRGGHFTVSPSGSFEASQRYLDRTNVLRTRFETASGRATVTDFMPVPTTTDGVEDAHHALYRKVECDDGPIDLNVRFEPRFDYARTTPSVKRSHHGVVAHGDGESAFLTGSVEFDVEEGGAGASLTLEEGEMRWLVLGYDREIPDRPAEHRRVLDDVVAYWRDWAHECPDDEPCPIGGPQHDLAVRSALALKLLIHDDTGAICAAPTTSLPEDIGGVRNWDYRYNWIRDSAFTVQALAELGHVEEAKNYFELCLSHCSGGLPADIQPVYGLHGNDDLPERTLDHLSGYRDSAPVRVGNAAHEQRQLDIYGELIVGVHETTRYGAEITDRAWAAIRDIVDYVCDEWCQPDVGIWEVRGDPQNFVYSKVMCWAAIDRALRIVDETDYEGPVERWRDVRGEIKETVLEKGYSDELDSFVRSFEADDQLDAATLRIPMVDFLPADDERVRGTIDAVQERLTTDDGLVDRFEGDDGLPGEEGAFVVCSFWLVNALALAGRDDEARDLFEDVCEFVSPLGLLSEEIDPETGELLGNYPQAFSQIGLINGALALDDAGERDASSEPSLADAREDAGASRSEDQDG